MAAASLTRAASFAACLLSVAAVAAEGDSAAEIVLLPSDGGRQVFAVRGLTPQQLASAEAVGKEGRWTELFSVFAGAEPEAAATPMFGRYSVKEGELRFEPRYPLDAGGTYTAVFRAGRPVTRRFDIPAAAAGAATTVTRVYPTGDVLPENLLKFYVHFSGPMSRGDSYRHLRLLNEDGSAVELPFLELGEELWNDAGTRLTVLLDPGRIKKGVRPREEVGPALAEGRRYMLVVAADWRDAAGRPLAKEFRKTFRAGPADSSRPDVRRWVVASPRVETREPLVVRFDEPLDHALAERVIAVRAVGDGLVRGEVEIDSGEARWRFRPERPWAAGRYEVVAGTVLEDRAGNGLGRAFEVAISETSVAAPTAGEFAVPFEVAANDAGDASDRCPAASSE